MLRLDIKKLLGLDIKKVEYDKIVGYIFTELEMYGSDKFVSLMNDLEQGIWYLGFADSNCNNFLVEEELESLDEIDGEEIIDFWTELVDCKYMTMAL